MVVEVASHAGHASLVTSIFVWGLEKRKCCGPFNLKSSKTLKPKNSYTHPGEKKGKKKKPLESINFIACNSKRNGFGLAGNWKSHRNGLARIHVTQEKTKLSHILLKVWEEKIKSNSFLQVHVITWI